MYVKKSFIDKNFKLIEFVPHISVAWAAKLHKPAVTKKTVVKWCMDYGIGLQHDGRWWLRADDLARLFTILLPNRGRYIGCTGGRGKSRECFTSGRINTRKDRIDCLHNIDFAGCVFRKRCIEMTDENPAKEIHDILHLIGKKSR